MADNEPELKAGHPPAVKAGKMRITQHKNTHEKESNKAVHEEVALFGNQTNAGVVKSNVVSGAHVHGNADFPPEAVQSYHQKPKPCHEMDHSNVKPIIHQPRK